MNRRKAIYYNLLAPPRPYRRTTFSSNREAQPLTFSKLPNELQQEIIKLSLPGPRIITIIYGKGSFGLKCNNMNEAGHLSKDLKARAVSGPVPAFLHVCQTTRAYMLKTYQLHFAENLHKGPIYFDVKRDSLYFEKSLDVMAFFGRKSLKEHKETLHLLRETEQAVSTYLS